MTARLFCLSLQPQSSLEKEKHLYLGLLSLHWPNAWWQLTGQLMEDQVMIVAIACPLCFWQGAGTSLVS